MRGLSPLLLAAATASAAPNCRCLPTDACWQAVPWQNLNNTLGGRLLANVDPVAAACAGNMNSAQCASTLNSTDDEFWLTAQPSGYLHTGQFGVWNLTTSLASYVVPAQSESDIQAGVAFAASTNLRLVVKNTGHDWYGRSSAGGSLMIWTHQRKAMTWLDSFVPSGCPASQEGVEAVTLESGVQFMELYQDALARGKQVIGGTCDSVGAAGCFLGGCYGTMSKLYGAGASNMLQAKVVLANGTLVIANECTNADLFWSLRGGAGGLAGVVTEFTVRTFRAPEFMLTGGGTFQTYDVGTYQAMLEQALVVAKGFQTPAYGGGMGFGRNPTPGSPFYVSLWPKGFEVPQAEAAAILQPLVDWALAQPAGMVNHSTYWSYWNASTNPPGTVGPWVELHPDREISTALLGSYSKYPTMTQLSTPAGVSAMAQAFVNMTLAFPMGVNGIQGSIDFEKGQAGASPDALARLANTSVHPVVADAIGILLVMYNIPSLPTLPLTSTVLSYLWPRLKEYAVISSSDPLYPICEAGAGGNETAASLCSNEWLTVRAPALQAQLAAVKATLWEAFPNEDPVTGATVSGSYWHEADYGDQDWQRSHWGDANYARLLEVKFKYDPTGLFICHHCVGSEFWTPDGNCLLEGGLPKAQEA